MDEDNDICGRDNSSTQPTIGTTRRGVLECMTWAGAGVLWTLTGGVPQSFLLGSDEAQAAAPSRSLSFVQISDSHIGYTMPANPNVLGTLQEAIDQIKALPAKPAFMIHTGDITHLSKDAEFDNAGQVITGANLDVHYVPGEHDFLDEGKKAYLQRFGKGTKGAGWYSFDASGVHFIGLVNVASLKVGGMGQLGDEQLDWLRKDLDRKSFSTPIVVLAHVPLWIVYPHWGWGTLDGSRAMRMLRRFGSVTVLNGHIHQIVQKVEGNITFHTARSTAYPQPAPGKAAGPGAVQLPAEQLRTMLGLTSVSYRQGSRPLALVESTLGKA
ncbi:MAG: metallophosphoesterase [Rhodomicrobium sp.]